jgi:ABC-2 type transport system ATP-binding protein
MTAQEYLIFMCKARKVEEFDCNKSNIFDLPLSSYASTFSTGMKKKLALTALLMQKNQFFILDEPFSGVDFESNLMINHILQKIKAAGKTILISSHILSSLTEICDQIHFLKAGKIDRSVSKNNFEKINQNLDFIDIESKLSQLDF